MPVWYWKNGLHDAVIKNISFVSLNYDFTLKNPIRNYILIELDSNNALFERSIKSIKFFNAKLLSGINEYCGWWWVSDTLEMKKMKYVLEINLATKGQKDKVIINFDDDEVARI